MRKIPFDNLVLREVVRELQPWIGAKIQDVRQPSDRETYFELFGSAGRAILLVSIDPVFHRMHLVQRMPANAPNPFNFCAGLRSRIIGARIASIAQIQNDRVVRIEFEDYSLVIELMGRHSNAILMESGDRAVVAMKWFGPQVTTRPVVPGAKYSPPPSSGPGQSTFNKELEKAGGLRGVPGAFWSKGFGVYPHSVAILGYEEEEATSLSRGLELHFVDAVRNFAIEQKRASLLAQIKRVRLAREIAILDLNEAIQSGLRAPEWQRKGDLLLAYSNAIVSGTSVAEVWDYEGNALSIPIDAELDAKQNAQRFYDRARKAKQRMVSVQDQVVRLQEDLAGIIELQVQLETTDRLDAITQLESVARSRRWLQAVNLAQTKKEDRPFEGHRIRELMGPRGIKVLYGENAEANDYLTLRIAKPNDWWLHVRGNTSAHVIIRSENHPEKVQHDQIEYAARLAVAHSSIKHSGFVSVDYTLKKYVRRPRGAAKGTAIYTHEKTIHVESE